MSKPAITNVLASRYASADLAEIWSATNKIALERRLWLAVLKAQPDLGIDVPAGLEHHARFTFAGPADHPCHLLIRSHLCAPSP